MRTSLSNHSAFQGAIAYGQFAKAGIWEEAWVIKQINMPEDRAIAAYVGDAQELAFEIFVGPAFFGLRCRGSNETVLSFARACVAAQRSNTGALFLEHLGNALGIATWGDHVEFAEIGAVNFWKSVGSYRCPDLAQAKAQPEQLLQALLAKPVGQNTVHPKAMELGCAGLLPHWFGLPVSGDTPPFALSLDAIKDVLALA